MTDIDVSSGGKATLDSILVALSLVFQVGVTPAAPLRGDPVVARGLLPAAARRRVRLTPLSRSLP